jgi:simple sugar transport system ATP-binding protein
MSIARNFWLGREPTRRFGPFNLLNHQEMNEQARAALADVGIHIRDPNEAVGSMSGGERQSIAIGRAVYFGKKLLILDEPTSALSVGETAKVLEYTRAAKARGMGVIYISHNIGQIHKLADRFTIISHGRKVGDFRRDDVNEDEVANMVMTGQLPERLRLVVEEDEHSDVTMAS